MARPVFLCFPRLHFGGGTRFENGKIRSLRIPNFGFSLQSPATSGKFRWLLRAILRLVFFILTAPELGTEYRRESRRYFYPASQDVGFQPVQIWTR